MSAPPQPPATTKGPNLEIAESEVSDGKAIDKNITKSHTASEKEVIGDVEALFSKLWYEALGKAEMLFSKYCSPKEFDPVSSDVFISSWMKYGTTLMQNVVY